MQRPRASLIRLRGYSVLHPLGAAPFAPSL
jgi:hypothetical protein